MTVGTSLSITGTEPESMTMHAAVITGPGAIELKTVERPEPAADEVLVSLEGCGVCASNLEVWGGQPWFQYPLERGAPGHEGWGQIDSIGESVTGLAVGDRVAFLSGHAYAEYDVAKSDQVVKLPPELNGKAFPGEPLGCAMNIFFRSDIKPGQTVAIIGVGFLGALLIQLAKNAGAKVIAISRREFALEIAKEFGAEETIRMEDNGRVIEIVKDFTEGKFCERVIEAVGKQAPLELAGELCAERGRLIIAGYHQDGPRQVNMWLWNWRGLDVINAHERDRNAYVQGMMAAVDSVVNGAVDPAPLYTEFNGLRSLGTALDATRDRPNGFVKALIRL